ncbi:MAG: amidohydrolase [Longimicrobiales bacterium]
MHSRKQAWMLVPLVAFGCATTQAGTTSPGESADTGGVAVQRGPEADHPFPSTYAPLPSRAVVIRNATIMTATEQGTLRNAALVIRDGEIAAVGSTVDAPADATVIDAAGRWVTPGLIDAHSHLGVYAAPGIEANSDGNEATNPNTAEVWAEHSVWPHDPQFPLALAGGVTTIHVLPGSANLFGGRGVTLRNVPGRTVQSMKFPGAPHTLKMACGENPKRVYGSRGRSPSTAMGNVAGYRAAWIDAAEYKKQWDKWRADGADAAERPRRNLQNETLMGVLNGEILIQNHCYRGDEMAWMMDIADEFGYSISAFHHGVEAYKVRDLLAERGICAAIWADWWGFKLEAYDGINENLALVDQAGGCAVLHTDSPEGIQRMNQDAAKGLQAGRAAGIDVDYDDAIEWITINPARAIGVDEETGSLTVGKRGDVVLWSGDPFSVYTRADQVYIDGALVYDRRDPATAPVTDFELGIAPGGVR